MNRQPHGHPNNAYPNIQAQILSISKSQAELFKLIDIRTRDLIDRIHKLQKEQSDLKLFIKMKMGAPDESKLKDILLKKLEKENTSY